MAKKKKCNCPPPGAPDWMVTYGDMVTLLLCFFVLIVAFSEIKKEDEFNAVVEEIKRSFGMKGGGGKLPTPEDPELSLIERLETVQFQKKKEPNRSTTEEPGVEGREPRVTQVREGMKFIVGTRVIFEPGSAEITPIARRALDEIAEQVRGTNNVLEIRGHAASAEIDQAGRYRDLDRLSYARASAARDYLIEQGKVRSDRFRLVAVGDREPAAYGVYNDAGQQPNRRVEVVQSETIIQQTRQPQAYAGG
ncbi:MAG: flagellar motor protein MotB [Planctomycetota bacterium]